MGEVEGVYVDVVEGLLGVSMLGNVECVSYDVASKDSWV